MIILNTKADCCGCSACFSVCHHNAICMQTDKEGFIYPIIDKEKCIDCGLCEKVCPIKSPNKGDLVPTIYAAVNKDKKEYEVSSSGGVFILLAKQIIAENGCVCGATYSSSFEVFHKIAYTLKECYAFHGSKYVQSNITDIYPKIKDLLNKNRKILFTGTPCQVQGLKLFLRKEYENLYTCDIICHGVPSPKVFKDYLNFVKGTSNIYSINMKSKVQSEKQTAIQFTFTDGKKLRRTLKTDIWNDLYFKHYMTRPSCHKCPFTNFSRPGDITIGDYWNVSKYYPDFNKDKMVSLVLVNTEKGDKLLKKILKEMDFIFVKKEECIQPQLAYPTQPSPLRDKFWRDYCNNDFEYIVRNYTNYTLLNRLKEFIKAKLKV